METRVVRIVGGILIFSLLVAINEAKGAEPPKLVRKPFVQEGGLGSKLEITSEAGVVDEGENDGGLKPLPPFTGKMGAPVHLEAKIYELAQTSVEMTLGEALRQVESGAATLLSEPSFAATMNSWSSHQVSRSVGVPAEYSAPSIPESFVGKVEGGGGSDEKPLATNTGSVIIPASPNSFDRRDVGLKMKFRPRLGDDGTLIVDSDLDQTILQGFADIGTPITREKKNSLGKRTKTETLLENGMVQPLFKHSSEKREFRVGNDSEKIAKVFFAKSPKIAEPAAPAMGSIYQEELRPILVVLSGEKVTRSAPSPKKSRPLPPDPQVYVVARIVEVSNEMGQGIPRTIIPLGSQSNFTDPQFQMMIRDLNQKKGIDLLSGPSIMLRPGQQGKVQVTREFIYPIEYDPPSVAKTDGFPASPSTPTAFATRGMGIQIQFLASLVGNHSIDLKLKLNRTGFIDFLDYGEPIMTSEKNALGKEIPVVISENRILSPVFREHTLETSTRIRDGETVMLGGIIDEEIQDVEDKIPFLGDLPGIGKLARKEFELRIQSRLYLFVKAQLVDSTGKPLNEKE